MAFGKVHQGNASIAGLRVCFVSSYPQSGTPYGELIVEALARHKARVTVFAPGADASVLRRQRSYEANIHCLPALGGAGCSRIGAELSLARGLLHARRGRYDAIMVQGQSAAIRAALLLTGPMSGRRVVYHNMDYYDPVRYRSHARMEAMLCRRACLYINNEFHRGYITCVAYGYRGSCITIPPNLPAWWKVPSIPDTRDAEWLARARRSGKFVLILNGGFSHRRMVPQLLRALALLPSRVCLAMIDVAEIRPRVMRLLTRYNLAERVRLMQPCQFDVMLAQSQLGDAGVLLYDSRDLGSFFAAPGRLTEYLIAGLPVIASNFTGLELLVEKWTLGETVDAAEPASIALGITRMEGRARRGALASGQMTALFRTFLGFDQWEDDLVEGVSRALSRRAERSQRRHPVWPWLPSSRVSVTRSKRAPLPNAGSNSAKE